MKRFERVSALLTLAVLSAGLASPAQASMIVSVAASPFTGPTQTKAGFGSPGGDYRPFDASLDLAYQGNGFAQAAVAKDVIPGFADIHQPQYANDGFYGNGASWIGNSPDSWRKIDLGRVALFGSILFGRDRLGNFDDRDPGQFTVAVALTDNIYANGDDSNDGAEYTQVFDSALAGYSGTVNGPETLEAIFSSMASARYVKLTFANDGAAIDEVEIRGTAVPEPSSLLLAGAASHPSSRFWNTSPACSRSAWNLISGQLASIARSSGEYSTSSVGALTAS